MNQLPRTVLISLAAALLLLAPLPSLAQDRKARIKVRKARPSPAARALKAARARKAQRDRKPRADKGAKGTGPVITVGSAPSGTKPAAEAGGGAGGAKGDKSVLVPGEKEFNECLKIPAHRRIKVTLKKGSELTDLIDWISGMTCKRFIIPDTLRAQKVTLISPRPIQAREAYRAFLSALDVMGLTVTPAGKYLKVVQGNWAIQAPIPLYAHRQRRRVPNNDSVVTQLLIVENTDVNNLLLVLNKMKSRSGDITAYKPSNMLIITDNAANVRRLVRIVKELDVASEGEKIWVVRLKKADPQDVSKILTQVFAKQRGAVAARRPIGRTVPKQDDIANYSASKIVNDEASNSLIIVATAPAFAKILSLIKKLDVESQGVNQKVHVYYLENADAADMNTTLSNLTGGSQRRPARGRRGRRPARGRKTGGTATLFEGDVKVSADKPTNSLVIVATSKDYINLRRVIKQLDIPRRQVFVEASILEISLDKSRKMGFAYHGGGTAGEGDTQSIIFGGVQHDGWNSLLINPLGLMGLAVGARGAQIDGSGTLLGVGQDIPAFGVMFQALQNNSNVHILSSPHILTTDNEKAEITVGQNLPFQGSMTGGFGGGLPGAAGSGANQASQLASFLPGISVQRQDVALKLKLTPHVNDSDMVRLELEQEVSDIVSQNFNGLGPATSKRTAKTTVVVRDQQTVVIGGLMSDRVRNSVSKVPLLGDIPLLGYFFKYKKKTVEKTNLLIVLTPYVIRDQADLRRILKKKLEERREFIERFTTFTHREITSDIDFRHKRGLLAEINRVAVQAEAEAKIMSKAREQSREDVEPVEMPKGMGTTSAPKSSTIRLEQQPRMKDRPPVRPIKIHPSRAGTIHLR